MIRGSFSNNLANQRVSLHVEGSGPGPPGDDRCQRARAVRRSAGRRTGGRRSFGRRRAPRVAGHSVAVRGWRPIDAGGWRWRRLGGARPSRASPRTRLRPRPLLHRAESAPLPVRTVTASGALSQTEALVIVFGFFAIAAGTIQYAVRRPASQGRGPKPDPRRPMDDGPRCWSCWCRSRGIAGRGALPRMSTTRAAAELVSELLALDEPELVLDQVLVLGCLRFLSLVSDALARGHGVETSTSTTTVAAGRIQSLDTAGRTASRLWRAELEPEGRLRGPRSPKPEARSSTQTSARRASRSRRTS